MSPRRPADRPPPRCGAPARPAPRLARGSWVRAARSTSPGRAAPARRCARGGRHCGRGRGEASRVTRGAIEKSSRLRRQVGAVDQRGALGLQADPDAGAGQARGGGADRADVERAAHLHEPCLRSLLLDARENLPQHLGHRQAREREPDRMRERRRRQPGTTSSGRVPRSAGPVSLSARQPACAFCSATSVAGAHTCRTAPVSARRAAVMR